MCKKTCLLATIAVLVVIAALDMFINGYLLAGIYQQTMNVWRPEAQMKNMMWMMWLAYVIMAPLFVYIFSKGIEEGKCLVGQGLKFGFILGIFVSAPMSLIWYAVLPIPITLAVYWFLAGLVESVAAGLVAGFIFKKSK